MLHHAHFSVVYLLLAEIHSEKTRSEKKKRNVDLTTVVYQADRDI